MLGSILSDHKMSFKLPALGKVVAVSSVHCLINVHEVKFSGCNCYNYLRKDKIEIPRNFLLQRPAFARWRLKQLLRHTFGNRSKVLRRYINI